MNEYVWDTIIDSKKPKIVKIVRHLFSVFVLALIIFLLCSFALMGMEATKKAEAAEYSEKHQQERRIKAEEAQAKALREIANTLKIMKRECKKVR